MESSNSSSSDDEGPADKHILRKPPPFFKKHSNSSSDNESGDEQPAFLPFSAAAAGAGGGEHSGNAELSGTVTLPPGRISSGKQKREHGRRLSEERKDERDTIKARPADSQRRASAALLGSPRRRPVTDSAGPSSPSMGSSFSDLSDASVTQSAMEEAYLSTMQGGGMASRMSSLGGQLGQAMRSRVFSNQQQQ